jgi:nucleotide-binding universal stress UspA family protein
MTRFRNILVPHDFSEAAGQALAFAAKLASPGGRLLVLHVVVPFLPVTDIPLGAGGYVAPQDFVGGAERQLERVAAKASRGRGAPRVQTKVVLGDPYQRIIAAARGMDAIVMATSGRTGLSHLLIGSVAEKVVRHSPIPVLTLRAGRPRGRKARR